MRISITLLFMTLFVFCALANSPDIRAEENGEWVKYMTWKGEVDELIIMRLENETVKVDYPVGSGFRNMKITFFEGDPLSECAAKVEVKKGRGDVAVRKQWWQKPDNTIRLQILDEEPGWGEYEFTVYYLVSELSHTEKGKYENASGNALYKYDVHHMNKSIAKDDLVNALRWARSAYEINRLNWEILNIIGELHYLLNSKDQAEDVFIILRDYGYLTDENMERFKELDSYEASKKPKSEEDEEEKEE